VWARGWANRYLGISASCGSSADLPNFYLAVLGNFKGLKAKKSENMRRIGFGNAEPREIELVDAAFVVTARSPFRIALISFFRKRMMLEAGSDAGSRTVGLRGSKERRMQARGSRGSGKPAF
jgi:hypothetical protein